MNNIDYGLFETKPAYLKLDSTTTGSQLVLSESELVSVQCDFQYFQFWLKKKQINQIQAALIKFFFSKTSFLKLNLPLNSLTRLFLMNIDIRSFKNNVLNNGFFKVFDKQLGSYVEYVECKQVDDNPAIAIGTSKLIFYYKDEVIHEKVLAIY